MHDNLFIFWIEGVNQVAVEKISFRGINIYTSDPLDVQFAQGEQLRQVSTPTLFLTHPNIVPHAPSFLKPLSSAEWLGLILVILA